MGGRNTKQVRTTIGNLQRKGMDYTLDLLGEAVLSEAEANHYQQAYITLLKDLAQPACCGAGAIGPGGRPGSSSPARAP